MKVYLDTNVFVDMIVPREDTSLNEDAMKILLAGHSPKMELCVSPITIATTYYLCRKVSDVFLRMKSVLAGMTIIPVGEDDVRFSIFFDFPDREDAMHMACAKNADCDLILTRNPKHFTGSPVICYTPSEFLSRLKG